MKEQKLIEMQNKVNTLGSALNRVVFELEQLKTLSVGNMELMKLFPDYESALLAMTKKQEEAAKDNEQGLENFDNSQ